MIITCDDIFEIPVVGGMEHHLGGRAVVCDHKEHEAGLGLGQAVAELAEALGSVRMRPGLGPSGKFSRDIIGVRESEIVYSTETLKPRMLFIVDVTDLTSLVR